MKRKSPVKEWRHRTATDNDLTTRQLRMTWELYRDRIEAFAEEWGLTLEQALDAVIEDGLSLSGRHYGPHSVASESQAKQG